MSNQQASRFFTLLQREFREYRNSMFWTPVITACLLGTLMLGSAVMANRISFFGDALLDAMMKEGASGLKIDISFGDDEEEFVISEYRELPDEQSVFSDDDAVPQPPSAPSAPGYQVTVEDTVEEDAWNFSREWTFNPEGSELNEPDDDDLRNNVEMPDLNAILSIAHGILLLLLLVTTANYLLSALYDDRKDRSILFWRSMPVGEGQVVLSKFVTALCVAPLIYIAVSLILQVAFVVFMMLFVWRMGQDPFEIVVGNVDFVSMLLDPLSGWILTALLIAPTYAWFLCASAMAKRSPFLMAVTPFIALMVAEGLIFGTERIGDAAQRHFPHVTDESAVGFYLFGPDWTQVDLLSIGAGLLFSAGALGAAIWLRRNRWELT